MEIYENPYEGINFYPDAKDNKYGATIGYGKKTLVIGFFSSLQEAMAARMFAIAARQKQQAA